MITFFIQAMNLFSFHLDAEQKHVETNLKATFAGISFRFSFLDEDQFHSRDHKPSANSYVHYIGAKFKDTLLVLQVIILGFSVDSFSSTF